MMPNGDDAFKRGRETMRWHVGKNKTHWRRCVEKKMTRTHFREIFKNILQTIHEN